jgi:hypothetical protein
MIPKNIIIFYFIIAGTNIMADMSDFLPASINGWLKKEIQKYNTETLYEYINGGAELYISYGFKNMVSCRYQRENEPDVLIDIFDMQNSHNAFGLFTHFRELIDTTYGQGSQYTFGNLLFWKANYFISILASPETENSKIMIDSLAQYIDHKIKNSGPIPEIINLIPKENLIKESLRYFRHYIWLNSFYYISDKNILNIDQNTKAVLAKYQLNEKQSIFLLVQYESEKNANDAIEKFINEYLPEFKSNPVLEVEDGSWVGYKLQGKIIRIVFNAATEAEVKILLK